MKRKTLLAIVKAGVGTICGIGVSIVVGTVTGKFCEKENLSLAKKIAVLAGGIAVGGMVGDAVKKYTDSMIDEGVECYDSIVQSIHETEESEEEETDGGRGSQEEAD